MNQSINSTLCISFASIIYEVFSCMAIHSDLVLCEKLKVTLRKSAIKNTWDLPIAAVSSCHNPAAADKGAAAHEGARGAAAQQCDLVGKLSRVGITATHNPAATPHHRGAQQLGGPGGSYSGK